jgi:hypothetical protein
MDKSSKKIICPNRENNTNKYQLQAGFLTCILPKKPLPIVIPTPSVPNQWMQAVPDSGQMLFGSAIIIAANAYSGATVTDFHRVPI